MRDASGAHVEHADTADVGGEDAPGARVAHHRERREAERDRMHEAPIARVEHEDPACQADERAVGGGVSDHVHPRDLWMHAEPDRPD